MSAQEFKKRCKLAKIFFPHTEITRRALSTEHTSVTLLLIKQLLPDNLSHISRCGIYNDNPNTDVTTTSRDPDYRQNGMVFPGHVPPLH